MELVDWKVVEEIEKQIELEGDLIALARQLNAN
jgi:hypothetical protein